MNEPRCFFWIASRNAARAVAMTRAGVESERLVDCSHSLYPRVMASGGKPRGHPCSCPSASKRVVFLDCFPPASRDVAMTRMGVESERLVDCSHSLYPFVMASGGKPRGHPYFGRDERAALFFWIASRNASRAVAMTRGGVKMPCTSSQ